MKTGHISCIQLYSKYKPNFGLCIQRLVAKKGKLFMQALLRQQKEHVFTYTTFADGHGSLCIPDDAPSASPLAAIVR
jgi:hypothetical protein